MPSKYHKQQGEIPDTELTEETVQQSKYSPERIKFRQSWRTANYNFYLPLQLEISPKWERQGDMTLGSILPAAPFFSNLRSKPYIHICNCRSNSLSRGMYKPLQFCPYKSLAKQEQAHFQVKSKVFYLFLLVLLLLLICPAKWERYVDRAFFPRPKIAELERRVQIFLERRV